VIVLTASVPEAVADAAAGLLHQHGASGVELRDRDSLPPPGEVSVAVGLAEVRGYFDLPTTAEAAAEVLRQATGAEPDLEELPVEDWSSLWKSHFKPQRRGRILVVAPWMGEADVPTPHGGARIVLEPGLAFGTGDHPTTGQCLEEVDVFLQAHPEASVLDVGTGSGILAIAARKLGAGVTVAIDNDPIALRVARENALVNRTVFDLRPEIPKGATFDLVLANILANTLVELAPILSRVIASGGRLVLSGILEDQAEEVERVYRAFLVPRSRRVEANWVCLILEKQV